MRSYEITFSDNNSVKPETIETKLYTETSARVARSLPCKPLALSAKRGQNGGEKIAFCQLFVTHFSAADFEKFEHKT